MAKAIDTMKKSESVINRRALLGRSCGRSSYSYGGRTIVLRPPYHRPKPQSRCSPPAISVAKCWH